MDKKAVIHFFTIADYEEEEIWLHNQHLNGWKLVKMIPPCIYIFEVCAPAEIAYRLDYKNNSETSDYFQFLPDFGWEYIGRCVGWLYFRKPTAQMDPAPVGELFSDNASRIDLIDHVVKTRLLPVFIIFVCCVFPNFLRTVETSDPLSTVFAAFFAIVTLIYVYLLVYCGLKLRKLREKYKNN